MSNYIDGFAFPIATSQLGVYKQIVKQVSEIWKEHGAITYQEFVGDDMNFEGTGSFPKCLGAENDETIIFGWIEFSSREARDIVHQKVSADHRMAKIIKPIMQVDNMIFEPQRMAYGGFLPLLNS